MINVLIALETSILFVLIAGLAIYVRNTTLPTLNRKLKEQNAAYKAAAYKAVKRVKDLEAENDELNWYRAHYGVIKNQKSNLEQRIEKLLENYEGGYRND